MPVLVVVLALVVWTGYRAVNLYRLRQFAMQANDARHVGNWPRLELISRRWMKADPQTPLPLVFAAEAAEQQQEIARAAEYLERLPDDDWRTQEALLDLATMYFGPLNRPDRGEATCLRVLETNPEHVEARRRLVFYYGITLQRTKMVRHAREAIRLGCDTPETYVYLIGADWITFSNAYQLNGRWLRSGTDDEMYTVAQVIHWAGTSGADDAAAFVEDVESHKVKIAEHERQLRACLKRYPENPELLAYFLRRSATNGDTEAVADYLMRVPASANKDNRFWHFKGWLHAARGQIEEAESAYRKALELNPFDWRTQFKLAEIMRQQQKFSEAERLASLALEGKRVRKTVLQLADVQTVPLDVLETMHSYIARSGAADVAKQLALRIEQRRAS